MTLTAWFRVKRSLVGVDGSKVWARAEVNERLSPWSKSGDDRTVPGVSSNTEGEVQEILIEMSIKGKTKLRPGDIFNMNGHFDGGLDGASGVEEGDFTEESEPPNVDLKNK